MGYGGVMYDNWVTEYQGTALHKIQNLDGVWWHQALAPPRKHKCVAQTRAWMEDGHYTERCACGSFGPEPFFMLGKDEPRVGSESSLLERLFHA